MRASGASIRARAAALKGVLAVVTAADFPELPVGATIPMGETGYDMWMVARDQHGAPQGALGRPAGGGGRGRRRARGRGGAGADRGRLRAAAGGARHRGGDRGRRAGAARARAHQGRRAAAADAEQCLLAHRDRARRHAGRARRRRAATARVSVQVDTAHQGYLEPQAVVAEVDANGFATVWASTQGQFTAELMIAAMLGLPTSKLKVVPLEIGGGFGGKIAIHGEAVAVRLAQKCRPAGEARAVARGGAAGRLRSARGGADRHRGRRRQGRPARRDRRHLPARCGRAAGPQPLARDAGLGGALPVPQPQSPGLRRRHQQAAHRGLSRARRHPGGVRHGAGDGHAVPEARHGPAGVPPAQRRRDRQHHADRHAVSGDRTDHHSRTRAPACLLARSAARRSGSARARTGARLLARHVDDVGRPRHDRRRRPADGDHGRGRPLGHAHHHGAGGGRGVRARDRGRARRRPATPSRSATATARPEAASRAP